MKKIILFSILLFCLKNLSAQPFEIRATNKGSGFIGIEMRSIGMPSPTMSNNITDLIFGIKWLKSLGTNLDLMVLPPVTPYWVQGSGIKDSSGLYYFRAFGVNQFNLKFPYNWTQNTWYLVDSLSNNGLGAIPFGTFEICEVGFDAALSVQTGPNIGVNFNDYTPTIGAAATFVPLPIELLSFNSSVIEKSIVLDWQVSNARGFKQFEVERSDDAKEFRSIQQVFYEQKTNIYYYEDTDVQLNKTYYYRLKLFDNDGQVTYSAIRQAEINGKGQVKIYPNPTKGKVTVEIENQTAETNELKVFSNEGRLIFIHPLEPSETFNSLNLDFTGQPAGNYFIYLGQKLVHKLVVQ